MNAWLLPTLTHTPALLRDPCRQKVCLRVWHVHWICMFHTCIQAIQANLLWSFKLLLVSSIARPSRVWQCAALVRSAWLDNQSFISLWGGWTSHRLSVLLPDQITAALADKTRLHERLASDLTPPSGWQASLLVGGVAVYGWSCAAGSSSPPELTHLYLSFSAHASSVHRTENPLVCFQSLTDDWGHAVEALSASGLSTPTHILLNGARVHLFHLVLVWVRDSKNFGCPSADVMCACVCMSHT